MVWNNPHVLEKETCSGIRPLVPKLADLIQTESVILINNIYSVQRQINCGTRLTKK